MTTRPTRTKLIAGAIVMIVASACGSSTSKQAVGGAPSLQTATGATSPTATTTPATTTPATTTPPTTTPDRSSTIRAATSRNGGACMQGWVQLQQVAGPSGTVYRYQLDNADGYCHLALHEVQVDQQAGATGQPVKVLALVVAAFADAVDRAKAATISIHCTDECNLTATSDPKALDLILPPGPGYPRLRAKLTHPTRFLLISLDVDGIKVG